MMAAQRFDGFQPILVAAGGYDILVEFRRGVEIVVVVVKTGLRQALSLAVGQHTESHAGFKAQ